MPVKAVGGRPTVFDGKVRDVAHRFQGWFSAESLALFEVARSKLAGLAKWGEARPGDSDVVEFLLRGRNGTERYLREKRKGK